MRSRKPCVLARRRLFGWNVRLLTGDSRSGAFLPCPGRREGARAHGKPPGVAESVHGTRHGHHGSNQAARNADRRHRYGCGGNGRLPTVHPPRPLGCGQPLRLYTSKRISDRAPRARHTLPSHTRCQTRRAQLVDKTVDHIVGARGGHQMSETDLGQVWARSLDELSDLHIEPHQRAWLRLTRPLGLVENTALIATPNEFVKEQLETRLRALVTHALSRELGRSIQLAVTVDPAATGTQAPPNGPGAPTSPPDARPAPPADGHPMSAAEPGQPGAPVIIP